ncbi:DUF7503 family protein [Halorussus caseinilyticus]|uniref:Uncharacterized protein n=1 Tax=Halorussus caseinilyticus TaxID=3034025 RepID=A0ABD5WIQ3_9EURY|nr:hypothetical protein [Halorussus sp. DT72]
MARNTTQRKMAEYLEAHPRMMGALFTICLLLMQAGNVAANGASTNAGP